MATAKWVANIPSSVAALEGSCVVIPCIFDYPVPNTPISVWNSYWYKTVDTNKRQSTAVYSSLPQVIRIDQNFQNRTSMLGIIKDKNCSLKIDRVKQDDHGLYYFRIEMPQHNNYSFIKNTVYITVKGRLLSTTVVAIKVFVF